MISYMVSEPTDYRVGKNKAQAELSYSQNLEKYKNNNNILSEF